MVSIRFFIILFGMFWSLAHPLTADVKVEAEIEDKAIFEALPVKGLITVTYPSDQTINADSFRMEGKPLKVDHVQDIPMTTGNLKISIFRFDVEPKDKGLHILPEISVVVGGKTYKSITSTYQVKGMEDKGVSKNTEGIVLKLEAFVDGPTTLFPGQKTVLGYRYSFNGNIETSVEETPLLEAKGLIKVGEKIVKQAEKGDFSILQITQEVQGDKPGTYSFGPSTLEGFPYHQDSLGKRSYAKQKLSSVVPPVTITVKDFPTEDKPASFNGTLGNYQWTVALISPSSMSMGDEISLKADISGEGVMDTVKLPELCCQPGMTGLFRLGDLPPVGKTQDKTKTFVISMRPLSTSIKEIPSLEFSSFDPKTEKYVVSRSKPIPITVTALKTAPPEPIHPDTQKPQEQVSPDWQKSLSKTEPIEIEGIYPLTISDLQNCFLGTWWTLMLIPLGFGILIYQLNLQKFIAQKQTQVVVRQSQDYFDEALNAKPDSSERHNLLIKAFLLRLVERGELKSDNISPEQLSEEGLQGEVRSFLLGVEKKRYTGKNIGYEAELIKNAKALFSKIDESHSH